MSSSLTSAASGETRNFGLDVLRASAILMVFFAHALGSTQVAVLAGPGVDLFFVLSGFLIGRIYFRDSLSGSFSFWRFWRSRWWRTLPPYAGGIVVYLIVRDFTFGRLHLPGLGFRYLGFLQNYLGSEGFPQSWSLCVEEHFYLALPVVAFLAGRMLGRKSFVYLLPIAFFFPLVVRAATFAGPGMPYEWYRMTHFRCEGLIAGVWLAYLHVERRSIFDALKKPSMLLLPLAPIVIALVPRPNAAESDAHFWIVGFTFEAFGFAAWVRFLHDLEWHPKTWTAILIRRSVTGLALVSYSIYLTHLAFFALLGSMGFVLLEVLAGALVLGVVFYFTVERPAIATRDTYLRKKYVESRYMIRDADKDYVSGS